MTTPAMRTSRMWCSLKLALTQARIEGHTLAVAYVDYRGRTLLLWRDSDSPVGILTQAESGAWTAIVRSQSHISLKTLFDERLQSNAVNRLQDCDCMEPTAVEGGELLVVNNVTIGAVCAIDNLGSAHLSKMVATTYMDFESTQPQSYIDQQHSHFVQTMPASL